MAALPTMIDGWQLTPANVAQLVRACNERRAALIGVGVTGLPGALEDTPGEIATLQGGASKPLFLLMQELIEAMATQFSPACDAEEEPTFARYASASAFKSAVLVDGDWRRATSWADPSAAPTFSTGKIQTGDICGYWIVADIVDALAAMSQRDYNDTTPWDNYGTSARFRASAVDAYSRGGAVEGESTEAAARSAAISAHDASGGADDPPLSTFARRSYVNWTSSGSGSDWDAGVASSAVRAKHMVEVDECGLAGDVEFWHKARPVSGYYAFYDHGGLTQDVWTFFETVTFDATSGGDTPEMTAYSTGALPNPRTDYGTDEWGANVSVGCYETVGAVVRWTFTDTGE